jgi:lactam utilization protein B
LIPRSKPGSLHLDKALILRQARQLINDHSADTLCFHGDNPASVAALKCLYAQD